MQWQKVLSVVEKSVPIWEEIHSQEKRVGTVNIFNKKTTIFIEIDGKFTSKPRLIIEYEQYTKPFFVLNLPSKS